MDLSIFVLSATPLPMFYLFFLTDKKACACLLKWRYPFHHWFPLFKNDQQLGMLKLGSPNLGNHLSDSFLGPGHTVSGFEDFRELLKRAPLSVREHSAGRNEMFALNAGGIASLHHVAIDDDIAMDMLVRIW
jgi:hypothetical protein